GSPTDPTGRRRRSTPSRSRRSSPPTTRPRLRGEARVWTGARARAPECTLALASMSEHRPELTARPGGRAEWSLERLGTADVRAAAARIRGQVVRTPTLRIPRLDALASAQVELFLKAENMQKIG